MNGAKEAAWTPLPPMGNFNALGLKPLPLAPDRWQWRARMHGNFVDVWAVQNAT